MGNSETERGKGIILWGWVHDGAEDDGTGGREYCEERGGEVDGYGYLRKAAWGGRRGLLNICEADIMPSGITLGLG